MAVCHVVHDRGRGAVQCGGAGVIELKRHSARAPARGHLQQQARPDPSHAIPRHKIQQAACASPDNLQQAARANPGAEALIRLLRRNIRLVLRPGGDEEGDGPLSAKHTPRKRKRKLRTACLRFPAPPA